jgi:hypothetical protein
MKAYIPSNLNLSAERHSDKYHYILSTITYRKVFDKSIKENDYVPISSKILHDVINSRYKERVNELIDMEIIEANGSWLKGKKSQGYRFLPEYRNTKLKAVQIMDNRIVSKIEQFRKYKLAEITLPQHKYIFDCLQQIEILADDANKYVDETVFEDGKNSVHKMMIDFVKNIKEKWYWTPDKNGRIHNNITNLPRELRKFLRWQKNPLVEIDISNCQPFLFNKLIRNYVNEDIEGISTMINYLSYVTTFSDILLFEYLTTKGIFYDYLMEKFTKGYEQYDYLLEDLQNIEPRERFKVRFFGRVFYCSESDKITTNEKETFRKLFPNVFEVILHYKKEHYQDLANLLQQIESEIIINRIVPKLADKKIFALTIHDSILTTKENSVIVKSIIEQEIKNYIGLIPTIKIK